MLYAQKGRSKSITSVQRTDDSLIMRSDYGLLRISPKNDYIMRISFVQHNVKRSPNNPGGGRPRFEVIEGEFSPCTSLGIIYDETYSDWNYEETDDLLILKTSSVILEITKKTGSIRYLDINGKLFLSEHAGDSKVLDRFDSYKMVVDENTEVGSVDTADGVKRTIKKATRVFDKRLYRTRLYLDWQEDEALFGLGQAEEGTLNLRGTTQYLHQANMKIANPMLLSSKGYGILLATDSPAIFNDTEYGSYLFAEAAEQMDYYFIAGRSFDKIIKGYRLLSGKAVMLPKWAFGYVQCQERYESAEELINTVKEYRKRNVGLDCIVLDWMSWGDGLWGQKSFDERRFPDPTDMMNQLHELNAHLMISIWPNMTGTSENYKEFEEKKLLLPASDIYNAYLEDGRKLYWDQVNRGLFSHGLDAWWCDSSEPITPEWSHNVKPETITMYNEFVRDTSNFIPLEKCNSFGLVHAQGIYEGQRATTESKRVVNLTRSGYIGQQKYGTILWSGDTCASWDTFRKQIVAGLNFCATGLPYWTLDIGAFFVKQGNPWYWSGKYDAGTDDLAYRELYTRWFQYGAFLPMFRAHGTDIRREIWAFGEPGEMFYDALVKAVELRYSLMPYIYSLAGDVWHNDGTIMRMLAFDFPDDDNVFAVKDQYMFGKSIMVCPVTTPMYYDIGSQPIENDEYSRYVYLPGGSLPGGSLPGTRWYDFWTNEVYEGGQYIKVSADISTIPLFVKEGSIIPISAPTNYVNEIPNAKTELRVYPGRDCEFMLYDDDGDGYMYEKGEYSLTRIKWDDNAKKVSYESVNSYDNAINGKFNADNFTVKVIE